MRRVALAGLLVAAPAHAAPWGLTAEAGGELDSNVERIDTGPGADPDNRPIRAAVMRFGVRANHHGTWQGGAYSYGVSDLTRFVGDAGASVENVTLLAGDVRYLHKLDDDNPVAIGFGLTGADALPLTDPVGARTFSNVGGDALLQIHSGEDTHATFAVGGRHFRYKPDDTYDWYGPVATARLDFMLWQPPSRTKSLELVTTVGFESRLGHTPATENVCSPGSPPDPHCSGPTELDRRDRYERAGVELTWVGRQVASIGYQLIVIDSNSYGQSVIRHRATASATVTVASIYVTLLGVLQIDRYRDGFPVQKDPSHTEFTNIDDENRSSLQLRLARKLTPEWSLEARGAAWRNLGGGAMELSFHRELAYLGVVYNR